jgi:tRNA(fMet)-specific endonuclease VapC
LRSPLSVVAQRFALVATDDIAVSAVTATELVRGAYRSAQVAYNLNQVTLFIERFPCLPLDFDAALIAGRIDAELLAHGLQIGPYDTLIAAIALAHNLILVTHNVREFNQVSGLQVEDWTATS